MAGVGLVGGAVGGGIGLLVGPVDLDDIERGRDPGRHSDGDDDDEGTFPTALLGAWGGSALGVAVSAHAQADLELGKTEVFLLGSTAVLGSVVGLGFGAVLSGGRTWVGAGGFLLGSAGGAAFALWAHERNRRSGRAALLDVGGAGAALNVPSVQRRTVPLTPDRGWNVALVRVQFE